MTNYRIFLLNFLTVSWVFLSGLNMADDSALALENQKKIVELQSFETEHARKLIETEGLKAKSKNKSVRENQQKDKQTTIKATDTDVVDDNNPMESDGLEKPLDLTVPFQGSENADLKMEQKSAAQSRVTDIFAPETRKKTLPLELDGDFLMSPEPEAEKLKSVDGAGIVIKLKR